MTSIHDADNDAVFGKNLSTYQPMTTTPDFRELCAELLAALETEGYAHWTIDPGEDSLVKRARAALAALPPEPLTRKELEEFAENFEFCSQADFGFAVLRKWGQSSLFTQPAEWPTIIEILALIDEIDEAGLDQIDLVRAALERWDRPATPPPEPPTSQITFNAPSPPEEVIRLDKEGFHYKGQFVADAGEAHRLMMAFLEQNTKTKPEPPTVIEILALLDELDEASLGRIHLVRAALERWGQR